jgi:predicted amidohydrolase
LYAQINLNERSGGKVYNTSVLIGPKGEIVGKYRKVNLPPTERRDTAPGDGFPVCETEIGNIGFSICYDIMFPETVRCSALNGADIVIHSGATSYGCEECFVRVRANENMLWLITCNIQCARMSQIIDPYGNIIARQRGKGELVMAEIEPKLERKLPKDNLWAGVRSLRGPQTQEREPRAYAVISSPHPPVLDRYRNDRIPSTPTEFGRAYRKGSREYARIYGAALKKG